MIYILQIQIEDLRFQGQKLNASTGKKVLDWLDGCEKKVGFIFSVNYWWFSRLTV